MEQSGIEIAQVQAERKVFVGIDVHKKSYAVCALEVGQRQKKWTMPPEPSKLAEKLRRDYGDKEIRSVYEAGFSGYELHRTLEAFGIRSQVINAASVAIRSNDRVKTDRRDAQKLAEQLSVNLVHGIRIPTREEDRQRAITRTRQQLVRARTRVMIQIRRKLVHFGYFSDYAGCLKYKDVEQFLLGLRGEPEIVMSVSALLQSWAVLKKEVLKLNRAIKEQYANSPVAQIYGSFPGIGTITAQTLANELGDMSQFQSERQLFSFLGFTPSECSSGEQIRKGRISRQGNGLLRKCLVESAWVAIRLDQGLGEFYRKVMARNGSGKKTIVAVARKLAGRIRGALRNKEDYRREGLKTALVA